MSETPNPKQETVTVNISTTDPEAAFAALRESLGDDFLKQIIRIEEDTRLSSIL